MTRITLVFLALVVGACARSTMIFDRTDMGPEGPADGGPPDLPEIDGGPPDAGTSDAGPEIPEGDFETLVTATQQETESGVIVDTLAVLFGKRPGDVVIQREPVGDCELSRTRSAGDGFVLERDGDIGPIRIESGEELVTLRKGSLGYDAERLTRALWVPGATVRVTAPGQGSLSGFVASLTAPAPLTLTGPVPSGRVIEARADQPLRLDWTGAESGEVRVRLIYEVSGELESIHCRFDGALGTGTVSTEVLARIQADADDPDTTLSLDTIQVEDAVIEGWPTPISVELRAQPPFSESPITLRLIP
ncbi:MAG: hypothetical protein JJ863_33175 [Deltaproteobacteria bacterium]|nr:hypothetical protein [Deltaproteobacteria bacterium]